MMIEQLFHRKKYSAPFTERIDIGVYQLLDGSTDASGSLGAGGGSKQDDGTFGSAKPLPTSLWDEEPEDLWDEEPEESEEELDNLWR